MTRPTGKPTGQPRGSTTPAELVELRRAIAGRVEIVQRVATGRFGGAAMARRLGIPERTWYGLVHRKGHAISAHVILQLLYYYRVEAAFLLHGTGPIFRLDAANGSGWTDPC